MAFPAKTRVLTKNGWKEISKISGHDKVLVRNFIGDAQFIQPFAIKKKDYDGKLISGGQKSYQFRVTPEHEIVYTDKAGRLVKTTAEKVPAKRENRLKHRSRYAPDGYLKQQTIKVRDFEYQIDNLDWYRLVGYVLRRGAINKKRLTLMLDTQNPEKDMKLICPVLDRMGLPYTYSKPILVITQKSTIAYKLAYALGSKVRKQMFVPDKMIYNASIEEGRALIDMFVRASRRDGSGVDNTIQFSTTNTSLVDSLEILGLLCGYTISKILAKPAGTKVPAGETKRDSYAVYVRDSVEEISIIRKKELDYSGKVYEIDIFEDQLLIKEDDLLPVWMKPK